MTRFILLFALFIIGYSAVSFQHVENYVFLYDSCSSDYFVIFQQNETIVYAVNYDAFFEFELVEPWPPFFPNLLAGFGPNEQLLDGAIDITSKTILILTNQTWGFYDYNLNLIETRVNNGTQTVEYDWFGNLYQSTVSTEVWPVGQNEWTLNETTKKYGYISYTPGKMNQTQVITAQTKGQSWQHRLPRPVSGKLHVVDRNLFVITLLNQTTLTLETFPALLGAAGHEFCDGPHVFLTCEPCAFVGNISIARDFIFIPVETTIPYFEVKANETVYLGSNLKTNVTIISGTIIINEENVTITCEFCVYENATVLYQPSPDVTPEERCIDRGPIGLVFTLCQEESETPADATGLSDGIVLAIAFSSILIVIVVISLILYFNRKTRRIFFPFKGLPPDDDTERTTSTSSNSSSEEVEV